jgi:hypothetical protein
VVANLGEARCDAALRLTLSLFCAFFPSPSPPLPNRLVSFSRSSHAALWHIGFFYWIDAVVCQAARFECVRLYLGAPQSILGYFPLIRDRLIIIDFPYAMASYPLLPLKLLP